MLCLRHRTDKQFKLFNLRWFEIPDIFHILIILTTIITKNFQYRRIAQVKPCRSQSVKIW
jgi:hypothetical protein